MNFSVILNKFRTSSGSLSKLCIVIQSDAIYLSKGADTPDLEPLVFPIENNWETTLGVALSAGNYAGHSAIVSFSSNLYQSYQIDKPELPQEEWSSALPFLLKDLISERVTDIVADACQLPDGRRVQAYVLSKKVINSLSEKLENAKVHLSRIVPEDEVWGHVQDEITNFMLLHRGLKGDFKLGAYVNGENRFQRTIRGVVAPLTGNASSELQLDSIALELQRSIDYLSSQLRDASINHLLICCDEEQQDELNVALSERLSVKVQSAVSQDTLLCGQVLCRAVANIPQQGINLYPKHLKPTRELFSLTNVVASWLILCVAMFGAYGYLSFQTAQADSVLLQLKSENKAINKEFKQLQLSFVKHKASAAKLAAAERFEQDIIKKKATLKAIEQFDDKLKLGYSGVMGSLAKLSGDDISVSYIALSDGKLNLKGLARTPNSVPQWVKQFKTELDLVGRTFEKLNIGRNENDIVTFELTTQVNGDSGRISERKK